MGLLDTNDYLCKDKKTIIGSDKEKESIKRK